METQIRVLNADCDRMGVVYYSNYLKWFEAGRTEWFRQAGMTIRDLQEKDVLLPTVEARCFYKKSALYDELLTIKTSLKLESPKLLRFEFEILSKDKLLVNGYTLHLCMDKDRKVQNPPRLLLDLIDDLRTI